MSVTLKPESFTESQYRFASYIRDPENFEIPDDIEKRRMDLYRELMFNNVESFLSTSFPVLKKILDETSWIAMVQDFFARHRSSSPYFSEIPEEFLDYLKNEREAGDTDLPFLLELAHYEWVELALVLAPDDPEARDQGRLPANPLDQKFRVPDIAWPLVYSYPVHRISKSFKPEVPPDQPTYLVVYRNPEDEVHFMEINAVTYRLLQIIDADRSKTARDCLNDLSKELQLEPNKLIEYGQDLFKNLWMRSIVQLSR